MPNENVVRCPICGSTVQVKQVGNPTLSDNRLILSERFICGCGTDFELMYERDPVEGDWKICDCEFETFVDMEEFHRYCRRIFG